MLSLPQNPATFRFLKSSLKAGVNKTLVYFVILQNSRPSSYSSKTRSTSAIARESPVVSNSSAKSPSSWDKVLSSWVITFILQLFSEKSNLWNAKVNRIYFSFHLPRFIGSPLTIFLSPSSQL